jgi:ribose-phosphate pyrophosphokinase
MITVNGKQPKFSTFPGGEEYVDIAGCINYQPWVPSDVIDLDVRLTSSTWVMRFFMTVDAIRRSNYRAEISLNMPYVPYARQDRVCNTGESLSLRMFCDLINSLDLKEVLIDDPHSDVVPALLNRCIVITKQDILVTFDFSRYDFIVAPDAGAAKSVKPLSEYCDKPLLTLSKTRQNGEVFYHHWDMLGRDRRGLVVDDICDGGATFVALANTQLSNALLDLYVTHGIFSKGFTELFSKYDRIITTDSWQSEEELKALAGPLADRLTVIKVL